MIKDEKCGQRLMIVNNLEGDEFYKYKLSWHSIPRFRNWVSGRHGWVEGTTHARGGTPDFLLTDVYQKFILKHRVNWTSFCGQ